MSDDLKACPFCGAANLKSGGDDKFVGVWCLDCGCVGPNHYDSRRDWNIRADRIEELEAENHLLKTSGIAEVAVRNPNVMEYMRHWEGRAERAEANLAKAVEFIEIVKKCGNGPLWELARTTLAELTGGKDDRNP